MDLREYADSLCAGTRPFLKIVGGKISFPLLLDRITRIDLFWSSALDWSQTRSHEGMPRLFSTIGLARDTLHREAPELARDADVVVIDGPPRVASLMRSALLAADLVLIPVQPSLFDGWASAEMLALLREARIYRPRPRRPFRAQPLR